MVLPISSGKLTYNLMLPEKSPWLSIFGTQLEYCWKKSCETVARNSEHTVVEANEIGEGGVTRARGFKGTS